MKFHQEKFTKKDYSSPKLICYGDIRQLTRGGQNAPAFDSPRTNPPVAGRSSGGT